MSYTLCLVWNVNTHTVPLVYFRTVSNTVEFSTIGKAMIYVAREGLQVMGSLSIPLYVKRVGVAPATDSNGDAVSLRSTWEQWQTDGRTFWQQMDALIETLDGLVEIEDSNETKNNSPLKLPVLWTRAD